MQLKPSAPAIGQIMMFTKNAEHQGRQFKLDGALVQLEIFEGLVKEQNAQTANLTVFDPDNLLYPEIQGQEVVVVGFKQAFNKLDENYVRVFHTIDCSKSLDANGRQMITIHLTNPYAIMGKMVYFQKVFDTTSSKQCLETVCGVLEQGFDGYTINAKYEKDFDDSLFPRPLNVPQKNWEWIVRYWINNQIAEGKESYSTLFYFWDDVNGLHFKSNRQLLKQEPKHRLLLMKNRMQTVFQQDFILRFETLKHTDIRKQITNQLVTPAVLDLVTQEYTVAKKSKQNIVDKLNVEQKAEVDNKLIGQSQQKAFIPLFENTQWKIMGTQMNENQIQSNKTNAYYEDNSFTNVQLAEVQGDVTRCPGDMVMIARVDVNGNPDPQDTQIWLIRQVKHTLTYDKYIQTLELVK